MSTTVTIYLEAQIEELIQRNKNFSFLGHITVPHFDKYKWHMVKDQAHIHQITVSVIGKTGYGKSTILNHIIGKDVFKTDDVDVCTKTLSCAHYCIQKHKYYIAFCDLPGIGESLQADPTYLQWYKDMICTSSCIIYVVRADQRDFSVDEAAFKELFPTKESKRHVILALNHADKIEPVSRSQIITPQQKQNLDLKLQTIQKLFDVDRVVYCSAINDVNIQSLTEKIACCIRDDIAYYGIY